LVGFLHIDNTSVKYNFFFYCIIAIESWLCLQLCLAPSGWYCNKLWMHDLLGIWRGKHLDYKNHWDLRQFDHCQVLMLVHCVLFASHYPFRWQFRRLFLKFRLNSMAWKLLSVEHSSDCEVGSRFWWVMPQATKLLGWLYIRTSWDGPLERLVTKKN
jgi:hypothetical protein